jgi:hypothetical protein
MTLYAIDPGTEQSAVLVMHDNGTLSGAIYANADIVKGHPWHYVPKPAHLVIEKVESYGMVVGREVFDTVFWAGRFAEAWERGHGESWSMLPRRDVKLALCGSARAKDANIRQALIDRYGGPQCVKKGGPLAGIKSHLWAALALAVTYQDALALSTDAKAQLLACEGGTR